MKRLPASLILMLLFGMVVVPAVFGQSLPASMAYSSSVLVTASPEATSQKLLIAGNSLLQDQLPAFDLSVIPSAPDSVVRDPKASSHTLMAHENSVAPTAGSDAGMSGFHASVALLGVLAIACLATRKRPNPRMRENISELRNFPKKRLAHHGAHA